MKTMQIDDKWSVEYDPANNDSPTCLLRYGIKVHGGCEGWDNPTVAMFYALLEAREHREINPQHLVNDTTFVAAFLNALADRIHADNVKAGWWTDIKTGESILHTRNVPEMLMLIVSEVAEAMEGHRKNLNDDKLPHRPMMQTELGDAMIRIFDLAGSRVAIERDTGRVPDLCNPIGDIFEEKRNYNAHRADHKIENRLKDGGKAF